MIFFYKVFNFFMLFGTVNYIIVILTTKILKVKKEHSKKCIEDEQEEAEKNNHSFSKIEILQLTSSCFLIYCNFGLSFCLFLFILDLFMRLLSVL